MTAAARGGGPRHPGGRIAGRAVALDRPDIDTDQIIPAAWMKRPDRTGLAAGLFAAWRADPGFTLNQPGAAAAVILITGPNFGCGSSREHAVWALLDHGFRGVIAPGFADIFLANAIGSGLVPATATGPAVARVLAVLAADPAAPVVIDVARRVIEVPSAGLTEPFELGDFARRRLLEGLDDIALTLRHADAITAYETSRPPWRPAFSRLRPDGFPPLPGPASPYG